jgi:glyoxylase-like metal-dependent hydrolase (beta-lactamase superfamily II)/ferredoxin
MAQITQRLPENVQGDFYVDSTCIDCDACRQIAPASFRDHGGQSSVYRQPRNPGEQHRAFMALVACPTASIGSVSHRNARQGVEAFPVHVVEDVYYCGFNSEASFGAWAYLIVRPAERGGNVLVDSPRFNAPLVKRIEELGGVNVMFLSHRDDIADHAKFAEHFHCPRIMHAGDDAASRGIERIIHGTDPQRIDSELLLIPTPGHTRGHQVLLYKENVLFTGDHLAWSPERETLTAFRDVCWYSWKQQTQSMENLLAYRFSSVLPGHGRIHLGTQEEMHKHLEQCIAWMKEQR